MPFDIADGPECSELGITRLAEMSTSHF